MDGAVMNQPVLRSRQQPSTALTPAAPRVELSERMQEAKALASAGDLIPKEYRNNPGACLLARDWADAHDLSMFDVMGHVAFFNGKATVEARLQRKMAARAGYFTKVTGEGDEADKEYCTVGVYDSAGTLLGEYTMTHDKAKLLDVYHRNPNYKKSLDQMLLARATTRALDRYATAPTLIGVFVDEEEAADPVDVLRSEPEPVAEVEDIAEAEIEPEPAQADGWTVDSLKQALYAQGITQVSALRSTGCTSMSVLVTKPDLIDSLLFPVDEAEPAKLDYAAGEEPF